MHKGYDRLSDSDSQHQALGTWRDVNSLLFSPTLCYLLPGQVKEPQHLNWADSEFGIGLMASHPSGICMKRTGRRRRNAHVSWADNERHYHTNTAMLNQSTNQPSYRSVQLILFCPESKARTPLAQIETTYRIREEWEQGGGWRKRRRRDVRGRREEDGKERRGGVWWFVKRYSRWKQSRKRVTTVN